MLTRRHASLAIATAPRYFTVEANMRYSALTLLLLFGLGGCSSNLGPPPVTEGPPYQKPPEQKACEYVFCHVHPSAAYGGGRYCCLDGPVD